MDITFKTRKLQKTFNSDATLRTAHGARMVRVIKLRMAVLSAARTLALVPSTRPERRHLLTGNRTGQIAVDLVHPHRLVFVPNHDPLPYTADGSLDLDRVTAIKILDVVDYH